MKGQGGIFNGTDSGKSPKPSQEPPTGEGATRLGRELMAHKVRISHNDLIDMLENTVGGVYEFIDEGDRVTKVEITYGSITFTIGTEED